MRVLSTRDARLEAAWQAFHDYVGVGIHFKSPDKTWHPSIRLRLSKDSLLRRRDARLFYAFADKYPSRPERIHLLVSAFKRNCAAWIGEVMDDDVKVYHRERMVRLNTLRRTFRMDIGNIEAYMDETGKDIRSMLASKGQMPYIIKNRSRVIGGITDETLALMERAFRFAKTDTDDPLWNQTAQMLRKYHHWLPMDNQYLKEQLNRIATNRR